MKNKIKISPMNYYITEEYKKLYRKKPKKCYICNKNIKELYELSEISVTFPSNPLLPRSFLVHSKCKSKQEGGFEFFIK